MEDEVLGPFSLKPKLKSDFCFFYIFYFITEIYLFKEKKMDYFHAFKIIFELFTSLSKISKAK